MKEFKPNFSNEFINEFKDIYKKMLKTPNDSYFDELGKKCYEYHQIKDKPFTEEAINILLGTYNDTSDVKRNSKILDLNNSITKVPIELEILETKAFLLWKKYFDDKYSNK